MDIAQKSTRLVSLDAFRGATIAGMILVNDPGTWSAVFPQLRHAAWHGWTFTDFIFPFFLWIVGVAMTFSFAKRLQQGETESKLIRHIVQRAAVIFLIGLGLTAFPFGLIFDSPFSLSTLRIPGVLQRIGICYLFAGLILLKSGIRWQLIWTSLLLGGYWLVMKLVPVPGFGAGVLEPTGNLCWFIDSNLLKGHTWVWAPAPGFDPEGILSTIPAIATTLFGVLTGHWLRSERSMEDKTGWMFVAGNILLLSGAILDMWFPINKNLWSSSYAIFMAGWALVCFAVFYWLMDVKGYKRWATPFVIYGMNAIAMYVLAGLLEKLMFLIEWTRPDGSKISLWGYVYQTFFVPLASPMTSSLLFAIAYVLVTYVVAWGMWKKRWFLKV